MMGIHSVMPYDSAMVMPVSSFPPLHDLEGHRRPGREAGAQRPQFFLEVRQREETDIDRGNGKEFRQAALGEDIEHPVHVEGGEQLEGSLR